MANKDLKISFGPNRNTLTVKKIPFQNNDSLLTFKKPSSYLESRFETDIKSLLERTNRLESLVEQILEANVTNNKLIADLCACLQNYQKNDETDNQKLLLEKNVSESETETQRNDFNVVREDEDIEELIEAKPLNAIEINLAVLENTQKEVKTEGKRKRSKLMHKSDEIGIESPNRNPIQPKVNESKNHEKIEIIDEMDMETEYLVMEHDNIIVDEEASSSSDLEKVASMSKVQEMQKLYSLPIQNLQDLKLFDADLKNISDFQQEIVDAISGSIENPIRLENILYTIIDEKLISNVAQSSGIRYAVKQTYLCEKFLYQKFVPWMKYSTFTSELNRILHLSNIDTKSNSDEFLFPLTNEDEMRELDDRLNDPQEADIYCERLHEMYRSSKNGGTLSLADLLLKIVNIEIVMRHNWEGKHGKKQLSQYERIFSTCLRNVLDFNEDEFEMKIKKAIRTLQNREHIHNSRAKKRMSLQGKSALT